MMLRTKSASKKGTARRLPLKVEALEARLVPCADELGVGHVHAHDGHAGPELDALPAVLDPQPVTSTGAESTTTAAAVAGLPLPVLNSLPGAAATLYLDFDGDYVSSWLGYSNISTPAFDTDGNPGAFSATEIDTITHIWQIAAENFSPFQINVTTVDPRTVSGYTGKVAQLDIGGSGSWLGGNYGGYAQVFGFGSSSASNPVRGFVFPANLAGNEWFTGQAVSHEAGHTMGLHHQSAYSGTAKTSEYQSGPGDGTAPIMGNSYSASRGLWWYGATHGATVYQDDMAVLGQNFAYRTDEAGSTASTATPLTVADNQVSASGIITTMSDVDVWSFTTEAGSITLSVGAVAFGSLHPKIQLLDSQGNVVAGWQDPDTSTVSWTGSVAAGSYRLVVASHGVSQLSTSTNYGFDVGRYRITGSISTTTSFIAGPTNLGATAVSSSQINLTWADNATSETSYRVERSTDGTTWSAIANLGANSTSYADTEVTAGVTYSYRVRAFDGTTASAYSNQVSATPMVPPPAAPSNLVATASETQIRLTWTDNATNETSYSVERSTDGITWNPVASLGANSTGYTDTNVVTGMRYYYRVRDFSGNTPSAYSNQVSAATTVSAPAGPSNLVATPLSGTEIRLTWTDNATNETGYSIERSTDGTTWNAIANLGANSTSCLDMGVTAGVTYSYRVRAFNGTTASAYSNQVSATPTVPPPAAPSNLVAIALSETQIRLTWTDNATNETSYSVERSTDGITWSQRASLGANSTSYTDTSVVTGMRYYYRVRAFGGNMPSAYTNQTSAATTVSAPAAPSNLVATPLSGTEIRLTWTENATNETGYSVERSTDGATWSAIANLGANSTSYADTGVTAGVTYSYRVRAFNGTTVSAYSNQVSATPTVPPPAAPSNLVATALSETQIRLTWTDHATNETSYSVERSTDGSTWNPLASLGANSTSYTDTAVVTGMRYYYRVRGLSGSTPSAYSNQASAATTVSPPAAPSNLGAIVLSGMQIWLTWIDNATTETGYSVERSTDGTTWSVIANLGADSTSCVDMGVTAGVTYSYRVRAFNDTTASAYSNQVSATTTVSAPAAPSNLVATALSGTAIQLTWTENATNETGYSVERSTDGGTWNPIASLGANSTSYTDAGVVAGVRYH